MATATQLNQSSPILINRDIEVSIEFIIPRSVVNGTPPPILRMRYFGRLLADRAYALIASCRVKLTSLAALVMFTTSGTVTRYMRRHKVP